MKTKEYYEFKIKEAEQRIATWHLKIKELNNPKIMAKGNEPTQIISFRVPITKANELKLACFELVNEKLKGL